VVAVAATDIATAQMEFRILFPMLLDVYLSMRGQLNLPREMWLWSVYLSIRSARSSRNCPCRFATDETFSACIGEQLWV